MGGRGVFDELASCAAPSDQYAVVAMDPGGQCSKRRCGLAIRGVPTIESICQRAELPKRFLDLARVVLRLYGRHLERERVCRVPSFTNPVPLTHD